MIPLFSFTKEDPDLIKGQSVRDPLGTQLLWSSLGREIIPHLTEQTHHAMGFQMLISSIYFYSKYADYVNAKFDVLKEQLTSKNKKHAFSIENAFILLEQAFAFSYYKINGDWPLYGKRRVSERSSEPELSLTQQIVASQISTGVWGYYRGAAIRSGLLLDTGRHLPEEIFNILERDSLNRELAKSRVFEIIKEGVIEESVGFKYLAHNSIIKNFNSILTEMPQKQLLRGHLLKPHGDKFVEELAKHASSCGIKGKEPDEWRKFFTGAQRYYPEKKTAFADIIKCTNYLGTLDWIFEWLTSYNGESVTTAAKNFPVDLKEINTAKNEFSEIIFKPNAAVRASLMHSRIKTNSKIDFIISVINLHDMIAEKRGASRWIRFTDSGVIAVETSPLLSKDTEPSVTPSSGWRYDYYMTPLINIYRGLR